MKKIILVLALVCGLLPQTVLAAASGWYQLEATWLEGQFSGRFLYDSSAPGGVVEVSGTLVDAAQTTTISKVWSSVDGDLAPWAFVTNSNPADPNGYDAGFYLYLLDVGGALKLDGTASNSLYDWSNDFAHYVDESPLQSYSISAVPEPSGALLLLAGLPLLIGRAATQTRRRRIVGT